MKIKLFLFVAFIICSNLVVASDSKTITFRPDTVTLLRNPMNGWAIYEYGHSFYPKEQQTFSAWEVFDSVNACDYASILYIRVPYDLMEPEEGKYAWTHNSDYINFINEAKRRGLKLGFRVIFDNCVPQWVYDAGCKSSLEPPMSREDGDKMPYFDDPVFLEKFTNFVKAFAREYNNPDVVDFIDGYGLGRWGEGHGVYLNDKKNLTKVIDYVTKLYADNFNKVITAITLSSDDWKYTKPLAFDRLGFIPRRDGVGSHWFHDGERDALDELFPDKPFIAEGCYFLDIPDTFDYDMRRRRKTTAADMNPRLDTVVNKNTDFLGDQRFKNMDSYSKMLRVSFEDAMVSHANVFNLRTPHESTFWLTSLPDLVQKFVSRGGYRILPVTATLTQNKRDLKIDHTWENLGVGMLPNRHPSWNNKYKTAFALLDPKTKQVVKIFTDDTPNPADWLQGKQHRYSTLLNIPDQVKSGKYILCVGISDTSKEDKQPGIDLSVESELKIGKWVTIANIKF